MKKVSALCLLTLVACSPSCFAAEAQAFTGFTLGATVGLSHDAIDYSGYIAGQSSSKNNLVAGLNAAYGFALGESFVLSVGGAYSLKKTSFGQTTYVENGNTVYVNGDIKNHWSVFVAPGLRLAPQWLAYGKLSYHSAKTTYTDTLMGSGSSNHHGFGYGVGTAYAIARGIELNAEIQHVRLSDACFALSCGTPSATEFNVGVNYRF